MSSIETQEEQISLDKMIRGSTHIVLAHRATPAFHEVHIPMEGEGYKPASSPFVLRRELWVVDEVLKGDLSSNATVEAKPKGWRAEQSEHESDSEAEFESTDSLRVVAVCPELPSPAE